MKKSYTAEEWESLLPTLQARLPDRTIQIARARWVDGQRNKDLAEAFGLYPSAVSRLLREVAEVLDEAPDVTPSPQLGPGDPARARWTQEAWDRGVARWRSEHPTGRAQGSTRAIAMKSLDMAHGVLVLGHTQETVAQAFGVLQGAVQKRVAAMARLLEPYMPATRVPLVVWVRPDGVAAVQQLSGPAPVGQIPRRRPGRPSKFEALRESPHGQ